MEQHIVRILKIEPVTHNVKKFTLERPEQFMYTPGQATEISINQPGLENEGRPFTMTGLPHEEHLEFVIKIYKGHNGVTEKLDGLKEKDELILHDVFGTINYQGPGLFVAGGAGITPFIAILRDLHGQKELTGNTLLFANRAEEDIILRKELAEMLGQHFINILESTNSPGMIKGYITKELLGQHLRPSEYCYVCGPEKFNSIMVQNLKELGIPEIRIITEQS